MDTATLRHRDAQLALRAATVRDVLRLWPALDLTRLDRTYPAWADAVSLLVTRNRQTSAGLAAAYVRAFRAVKIGLEPAPIVLASALDAEQLAISLRVASLIAVKRATAAGFDLTQVSDKASVLTSGTVARLVMDAGRDTVLQTVAADPKARGWHRVLGGHGCDFCRMLAGRGAVYTATTGRFHAHDHCGCSAEPVYGS